MPGRTRTETSSRFFSRSSALGSQLGVDWEWLLCHPAKPKLLQRTGASFVAEEGPRSSHSPLPLTHRACGGVSFVWLSLNPSLEICVGGARGKEAR